ncbi:MAG: hypothetical protein HUJ28_06550 [Chromatiales bacterium]|nr:hypothetical protein [Chromatiales bacterium]
MSDKFPDKSPKAVEIGDLLLIRSRISQDGNIIDRRALLLQAKKTKGFSLDPGNRNQLYLYSDWPTFEYVRSTASLNGKERHIRGVNLSSATQYLLIPEMDVYAKKFPEWRCYPDWNIQVPVLVAQASLDGLINSRCFASELIEFILGNAGKPYESPPPRRKIDWCRVIHDLLEITGQRVSLFMKRASAASGGLRAVCFLSGADSISDSFALNQIKSKFEKPKGRGSSESNNFDNRDDEDGEPGGISIIEFIEESTAQGNLKIDHDAPLAF